MNVKFQYKNISNEMAKIVIAVVLKRTLFTCSDSPCVFSRCKSLVFVWVWLCLCVYVWASQLFAWKEQVHPTFIVGPKNKLMLIGH